MASATVLLSPSAPIAAPPRSQALGAASATLLLREPKIAAEPTVPMEPKAATEPPVIA
jgi:hypothetical protein